MNILKIKQFIFVFLASSVLLSCSQGEKARISGDVKGIDSTLKVTLYKQYYHKTEEVKSVQIDTKKSSFEFKLGELTEPTFYHLYFDGKRRNVAILLLEPNEQVQIDVDLNNFIDYSITGSVTSEKTRQLSKRIAQTKRLVDSLKKELLLAESNAEKERINTEINDAIEKQREFSTGFIWDNPRCRSSVMALYQQIDDELLVFDRAQDLQLFKVVGTALRAMYPESDYTEGVLKDIKKQERILNSVKLQQLVQDAESSLPDIALPNPQGDTVRLSSLKGKVVLIDFWVSTNPASLMENRELLGIYEQFKGKGFEVYQVSLDTEWEPWVAAIQSANLPWINVSELNPNGSRVAQTYNITKVPSNYLIDRNFDIVERDVFGKDLVSRLKETL